MRILVTGGAGFVGSHFVHHAIETGFEVAVLDDLRAGQRSAVPSQAALHAFAIEDRARLTALLASYQPRAVVHFAASIDVAESVRSPGLYFEKNVGCTNTLLSAMAEAQIQQLIFSSSAAVYGVPGSHTSGALDEAAICEPSSAYGESKLQCERMLPHFERAHGVRSVALRYFNAAGAVHSWGLAERHEPETHLIPLAIDAARGKRGALHIYGDDYPTPDGTALRDYVHVLDLARAHVAALAHLANGGASSVFNVGTGVATSVREVLAAVGRCAGTEVPRSIASRRAGDPATLVAATARIERSLGFRCEHSSIERIVADAWRSRP